MKAIVVTDQAAGTAGMTLMERPRPQAAINDVVVQIHASGFGPTELAWPSTWTDRRDRGRTPSIPGHDLAGVVTALGYGTTGLSVGQRVFGLADWYRDGTLAEYVAIEARNLAPLPGDVDFTVGASLPISGLTAWQGLFQHGRLEAGQSVLAHGAAGAVGSMVTQLAREAGAYVIGTGRTADRQTVLDFGAKEFVDLDNDALEDVGEVDLVFDVIGGDIGKRSAGLIRAGGTLVSIVGPPEARPADGLAVDFDKVPSRRDPARNRTLHPICDHDPEGARDTAARDDIDLGSETFKGEHRVKLNSAESQFLKGECRNMANIDRWFLRIAVIYALVAMFLGITMGIREDFTQASTHAHLNLVGWVSMALYALVYRQYPAAAQSRFAMLHFWIANVGAVLLTVGIYTQMADMPSLAFIVISGSFITILGMLIFTVIVYSKV